MNVTPDLPELPDLDELRSNAIARRDHFMDVVSTAQKEVDKANVLLERLGVKATTRSRTGPYAGKPLLDQIFDACYLKVLTKLNNHSYAGMTTLQDESAYSSSQVAKVMQLAEERGHVEHEDRGASRRRRFTLTEQGLMFLMEENEKVRVSPSEPLPEVDDRQSQHSDGHGGFDSGEGGQ